MACVGSNRLWIVAFVLFVSGVAAHAANIDKAIADAQSRRRAAESGLREIKSKVPDQDLVEIANATTKSARGSDPQKRLKMTASLRNQLQWNFDDPTAERTAEAQRRAYEHVVNGLAGRLRIWMSLPDIRRRLDEAS